MQTQSNAPSRVPSLLGAFVIFSIHALAWFAIFGLLLFYVPPHAKIFKEFKTPLPSMSINVINASTFLASYWLFIVPLLFLINAAFVLALHFINRKLLYAAGILFSLLQIAAIFAIVIMMIIPMRDLIRKLPEHGFVPGGPSQPAAPAHSTISSTVSPSL